VDDDIKECKPTNNFFDYRDIDAFTHHTQKVIALKYGHQDI
jgi:hypothetical protein